MSEKRYKKRLEIQSEMISRQSNQIKELEFQVENLKLEIEEKNKIINSVALLKNELADEVASIKKYKKEYEKLIQELRKMKDVMNQTVYRGRWNLVKFLIK